MSNIFRNCFREIYLVQNGVYFAFSHCSTAYMRYRCLKLCAASAGSRLEIKERNETETEPSLIVPPSSMSNESNVSLCEMIVSRGKYFSHFTKSKFASISFFSNGFSRIFASSTTFSLISVDASFTAPLFRSDFALPFFPELLKFE